MVQRDLHLIDITTLYDSSPSKMDRFPFKSDVNYAWRLSAGKTISFFSQCKFLIFKK